ncbi:hypothetical protein ACVWWO_005968 [Bradyrhizobium sp. F1.13.1]
MPASAFDPSGTFVDVLCGHPEQKYGVRVDTADVDRARSLRHQAGCARGEIKAWEHRIETACKHPSERARRQFADPGDQPRAGFVVLTDHALGFFARIIVKIFLELAFDDTALLLDHEDLALALHEGHRVMQRQRPDHANLVDVDADAAAGRFVEIHQPQRFHQIEMGFACGDDAVGSARDIVDVTIDRIGLCEGVDRVLLRLQPLLDLRPRQIGPAIVQAAGWRRVVRSVEGARRAQRDGGAGFHDLRDRLEADPHAGEAAQRIAIFTEFEILADACGVERRHEPAHESDVGLVRHRGRDAAMVVASDHQNAAMR